MSASIETSHDENSKNWLKLAELSDIATPAFVVNEQRVTDYAQRIRSICDQCECRFHYSVKPLAMPSVLNLLAPIVDGFTVSSLFDAKLVSESRQESNQIGFVAPAIRQSDVAEIVRLCDYVTCNSIQQLKMFADCDPARLGLRINPQLSWLHDDRYDPCRKHSKLGVALSELKPETIRDCSFTGLHVHNNCDSTDLNELSQTVDSLCSAAPWLIERAEWINLGGGYLLTQDIDIRPLLDTVLKLGSNGLTVFIEPGACVIRDAGFLIATVLDLIESDGCMLAILDTTVNHMPEVFEYQFEPDVAGHVADGEHTYTLVGCSCLAGDQFGKYSFEEPLEAGSRIVFENVGAYSIVKANTFNGINLPSIYALTQSGELVLRKTFTYDEYVARIGADPSAII